MQLHNIDKRIMKAGIALPFPPLPMGDYSPIVRHGDLLFISRQFPIMEGKVLYKGCIGSDLTIQQGCLAAHLAALNVLAHIRAASRQWATFTSIVRVEGYISSAAGWYDQSKVLDAASDLFKVILGTQSGHARTVFSCNHLPLDAAVELAVIASIKQPAEESCWQGRNLRDAKTGMKSPLPD